MIKVTIDLNVILDFLNKREDHINAAKIIDLCEKGIIKGYSCAHEITTLSYFLMKENNDKEKVKYVLEVLLEMLNIISITGDILKDALSSKINDYEDAVIEVSSYINGVDYIITRDLKDFKYSSVKPLSPSEFLVLTGLG